ncbi:MAG: AAA family ATPase [Clostridia bacterium]|nr:AAA family ATPase [Clostridia bacterium]
MNKETFSKWLKTIKNMPDVVPDEHDGSYELIRETVNSLANTPIDRLDVADMELLYFMAVGTWKGGEKFRLEKIRKSNLPIEEKVRLTSIFNIVVEKAKRHEYQNTEGQWSVGMFGTGFYSFRSDKENARKFLLLCIELNRIDDEDKLLNIAEEALKTGIKGMQTASASIVLHCLKPDVFPIINSAMIENVAILVSEGVDLHKPYELTNYIHNARIIKKFRDDKCQFRNYRALDIKLWEVSELEANKEEKEEEEVNGLTTVKSSSYTKGDFLEEVFMEEDKYDQICSLLNYKKNIILQGPPGTGKTFIAKRLAYSIMNERDDSRVEMVQFGMIQMLIHIAI